MPFDHQPPDLTELAEADQNGRTSNVGTERARSSAAPNAKVDRAEDRRALPARIEKLDIEALPKLQVVLTLRLTRSLARRELLEQ